MKRKTLCCMSLSVLVSIAAGGCSGTGEGDGKPAPAGGVARLDETRYLAQPVAVENLTVWPVVAESYPELGDFLTLEEAEKRGLAVVREVGSGGQGEPRAQPALEQTEQVAQQLEQLEQLEQQTEQTEQTEQQIEQIEITQMDSQIVEEGALEILQSGGGATVNQVVIENKSQLPLLICAGTVIKGGNQDRQIAQDFLVKGGTTVPVDAFCIEHGRWTGAREGVITRGTFKSVGTLAFKPVRASAQYDGDQSAVWHNVALGNAAASKAPATGTFLATIEETDEERVALRERLAQAVREHFEAQRALGRAAVGVAYAIDGKPVSVRVFAHPRLLKDHLETYLKTMAMEADLAQRAAGDNAEEKKPAAAATAADILAMVRKINEAEEEVIRTAALNENGLRRNAAGGNLNCYAEILLPAASDAPGGAGQQKTRLAVTQDWTAPVEK
jgi:hypothetical protein